MENNRLVTRKQQRGRLDVCRGKLYPSEIQTGVTGGAGQPLQKLRGSLLQRPTG
jgi:hypothetical protein